MDKIADHKQDAGNHCNDSVGRYTGEDGQESRAQERHQVGGDDLPQ